ncbi:MAG: hypothetical protein NC926_08085, partial [Candidatus Omnitrophica bacterium]|nr:hypothetical protein [Candidatus Omnitrophota bacterium]
LHSPMGVIDKRKTFSINFMFIVFNYKAFSLYLKGCLSKYVLKVSLNKKYRNYINILLCNIILLMLNSRDRI